MFSKSILWLITNTQGTSNSCTVIKITCKACLLRGIKDVKIKMPSDTTLHCI